VKFSPFTIHIGSVSGLFASVRPIRAAGVPHPEALGSTGRGAEFRRFYDRWFEDVSRWIRALGAPEADREDILQEVFLVVRRRLALFDGANPGGWLYQITRRQVRDFRNRSWVKHIFTRRRSDEPDALVAEVGGPEAALERTQKQRALGAILAKMHPDRRSVFVLFEIDGLSGEEIAHIQGIPLNTVWSRLRKARKEFFALAARFRRAQHGSSK
jgi:RNA polymerase sigma-70 factor (ECF subfamily)